MKEIKSYKIPVKKYQVTRMLYAAQGIETIFDNIFLWILFYKNIELMCYLSETNICASHIYFRKKLFNLKNFPVLLLLIFGRT